MNVIRESSILDGILHTTTKKVTKLCPAHLLPDSIPPSPQSTLDEDKIQYYLSSTRLCSTRSLICSTRF